MSEEQNSERKDEGSCSSFRSKSVRVRQKRRVFQCVRMMCQKTLRRRDALRVLLRYRFWLIGSGLIVLCLVFPGVVSLCPTCFLELDYEKAGQSGDMFGSLNTLFSGLAFAGFLLALRMQRKDLSYQANAIRHQTDELAMQREELKLQRLEMQNTREEMEEQVRLTAQQIYSSSIPSLLHIMSEILERANKGERGASGDVVEPPADIEETRKSWEELMPSIALFLSRNGQFDSFRGMEGEVKTKLKTLRCELKVLAPWVKIAQIWIDSVNSSCLPALQKAHQIQYMLSCLPKSERCALILGMLRNGRIPWTDADKYSMLSERHEIVDMAKDPYLAISCNGDCVTYVTSRLLAVDESTLDEQFFNIIWEAWGEYNSFPLQFRQLPFKPIRLEPTSTPTQTSP